jgi:hypothetical protein
MVRKVRPSPTNEKELCRFLSYLAEFKREYRLYSELRDYKGMNGNISYLLMFLGHRSSVFLRLTSNP